MLWNVNYIHIRVFKPSRVVKNVYIIEPNEVESRTLYIMEPNKMDYCYCYVLF